MRAPGSGSGEPGTGEPGTGEPGADGGSPTAGNPPVSGRDGTPGRARVTGVDATRGLALVGMIAVHVFDSFRADGTPTIVMSVAGGRAAATFAFVAGISLAFLSGGRRPAQGHARTAGAAAIAVRAALIAAIGLALGYVADVDVILPYYGVFFLLAIPLLGLRPRVLGGLAVALAVLVPLFLVATGLPRFDLPDNNLTFGSVLHHPFERGVQLLFTGDYPAAAWMVYICAGLAVGRLNLASIRVAAALAGGGLALAVASWSASSVLLFDMGGLEHLRAAAPSGLSGAEAQNAILWDPSFTSSWWWLAVRAPYTVTPITLLSTLGVAMAVLGAVLLLTRIPGVPRLLTSVVAAGTMTLTLYCAHAVVLATGVLGDQPRVLFVLLVAAALAFAVAWRRRRGPGPLERVVTRAANGARLAVASLPCGEDRPARPSEPTRRG